MKRQNFCEKLVLQNRPLVAPNVFFSCASVKKTTITLNGNIILVSDFLIIANVKPKPNPNKHPKRVNRNVTPIALIKKMIFQYEKKLGISSSNLSIIE